MASEEDANLKPTNDVPVTNSIKKANARKHGLEDTESKFELQQYLGESMDKAVSAARKSWDEYVSQYPGQTVDKNFLINNIALIHRLLEAVVPNVLQDNAILEDKLYQVQESYDIQGMKHLQDLIAVSGSIKVTTSVIETFGDLDLALDKASVYGIFLDVPVECDDPDITNESKLKSPFWLICAMLPNDTLSPHLIGHETYVQLMRGCKNVEQVELRESSLFSGSPEVDSLLRELDLE